MRPRKHRKRAKPHIFVAPDTLCSAKLRESRVQQTHAPLMLGAGSRSGGLLRFSKFSSPLQMRKVSKRRQKHRERPQKFKSSRKQWTRPQGLQGVWSAISCPFFDLFPQHSTNHDVKCAEPRLSHTRSSPCTWSTARAAQAPSRTCCSTLASYFCLGFASHTTMAMRETFGGEVSTGKIRLVFVSEEIHTRPWQKVTSHTLARRTDPILNSYARIFAY